MVYEKIDNYLTDAKLAHKFSSRGCGGFKKIKKRLMLQVKMQIKCATEPQL